MTRSNLTIIVAADTNDTIGKDNKLIWHLPDDLKRFKRLTSQKGLVEESDLRIPNMRGIMMARKKQLEVIPAIDASNQTDSIEFEKPKPKGEVTLVSSENLDELINLLHNEAKVI